MAKEADTDEDEGDGEAGEAGEDEKKDAGEAADRQEGDEEQKKEEEEEEEEHDEPDDGEDSSWETNENIRKDAFIKGLVRPLAILLTMSHKERQDIAAGLGICLVQLASWGDPYRESKAILWGVSSKSIQGRVSDIDEIIMTGTTGPRPNWYETVYRSMNAFGAARGVHQEIRSGGRSAEFKEHEDTIFAYCIHSALDPSQSMSNIEEALDKMTRNMLEAFGRLKPYFEVSHGAVPAIAIPVICN